MLGVGVNNISIEVTPENVLFVAAEHTYTVAVTRASFGASSNANLTTFTVAGSGGAAATTAPTVSPSPKKDVTSYTARVSNDTTTITVTPTLENAGASVAVTSDNDPTVTEAGGVYTIDAVKEGANNITMMVTAADLVTTKEYTLTVTRAAGNASNDARLSTLTVGGDSVSVSDKGTISTDTAPASDAAADYRTGVGNGVNSIAITATQNHSGATVDIFSAAGTETDEAIAHDVGAHVGTDGMVDLSVGRNVVRIQVTAEDGVAVRNYFLVITRALAGASSNANLTTFTVAGSGGAAATTAPTVSPSPKKDVTSYTARVSNDTTTITVTPTLENAGASVAVTSDNDPTVTEAGGVYTIDAVKEGANNITMMVTAADLVTTKEYTLTVTRAAGNASGRCEAEYLDGGWRFRVCV